MNSWQWFFIIEGAVSILVGVIAFFTLPDWPENTRWLTEEEREMAQYRVIVSNGGKEEQVGGTWDGLKEACKDPFTWMFCGMHFSLINAQSFKDFFPSVSRTPRHTHALTDIETDHQDIRVRTAGDIPRAGSAIRHRIRKCLRSRLELWTIQRIMLPYHRANRRICRRYRRHDLNRKRRSSLFWCHPTCFRHLQRSQLAAVLGDHSCACPSQQESGADCHCKLCQSMLALVLSLLLP